MSVVKAGAAVPFEHIPPVLIEGDCAFVMNDVAEGPDGTIILSMNAARNVKVSMAVTQPVIRGGAEMAQWVEMNMKQLIEQAKIKLGVTSGS